MPSIHTNSSGVSAGGYAGALNSGNTTEIITVYAADVIESPLRRFITDNERYAIAQLQRKGMLRDTYDADNDGIIDKAMASESAQRATLADRALNAENATNASEAAHAVAADSALNAQRAALADEAVRAQNANTAENAAHANLADQATLASTANRALVAEKALKADLVDWDNIENKPSTLAHVADITWTRVKQSAPAILADDAVLSSRLSNLERDSHTHLNKSDLDKLGHDDDGNPTWNNARWPGADGDMKKSTYDADGDGIVDRAKTVAWEDISGKPLRFPPEAHTINANSVETDSSHKFVTDAQIASWDNKQNPLGFTPEDASNKGVANGYASLDNDGKIPEAQIRGLAWEAIANKPTSAIADIDDAVNKRHTHANLTTLDKIGENPDGKPVWDNVEWPYAGDMKKEVFDADGDGIIDQAKSANTVLWSGVVGRPTTAATDIDDAVNKRHTHANTDALNLLTKDSNNKPLWNGRDWPFNMSTAVYDLDKDGIIDQAKIAQKVNWSGVVGAPTKPVDQIDDAVDKAHEHINLAILNQISENVAQDHATWKGKELAFKEEVTAISGPGGAIQVKNSIAIDSSDDKLQLVGDAVFPDARQYYGTNDAQVRGFHDLPNPIKLKCINSLSLDPTGNITLVNDTPSPRASCYYGTDENRQLGFHQLPASQGGLPSAIPASIITEDDAHRFVTKDLYDKLVGLQAGGSGSGSGTVPGGATPPAVSQDTIDGAVLGGTRQCILSASNNFFTTSGSDLILVASDAQPIIASFSMKRHREIIKKIKANLTVPNVPSVMSAGTTYIYLTIEGDNVVANKTDLKPIHSYDMPAEKENGRYWFNINTYTMYVSNGTTYVESDKPVLFIGEITSQGGIVTKKPYAINGFYDSGWYNVGYGTSYNKSHNMGTDMVEISAYRGHNGTNLGEFAFAIHASSPSESYPVGDRVSKITDMTVETSRYLALLFNDSAIYASSNQHRIIVRRAW